MLASLKTELIRENEVISEGLGRWPQMRAMMSELVNAVWTADGVDEGVISSRGARRVSEVAPAAR
jgi:hypothetical protein